jgi:tartrate dehydratase alpha subunit/fumarate hydratase class I-like protein
MGPPALRRSRALQPTLVAIIAANVDPLQSIACPHAAPAVVIGGGVEIVIAKERKAAETVVEAVMERKP